MSTWCHALGAIRLDCMEYGDSHRLNIKRVIESNIPTGSEGSLDYHILENREVSKWDEDEGTLTKEYMDDARMSKYTVTIFGDLRNYYDADAIIQWFKDVCRLLKKSAVFMYVRDACIQAYSENGENDPEYLEWHHTN